MNQALYEPLPFGTPQLQRPQPFMLVMQFTMITTKPPLKELPHMITRLLRSVGVPLTRSVWIYPKFAATLAQVPFALSLEDAEDDETSAAFHTASLRLSLRGFLTYPLDEMSVVDDPQTL